MVAAGGAPSQYHVHDLAELCEGAADRAVAARAAGVLRELLAAGRVIPLAPGAGDSPDTHTPLDLASTPDHPLRAVLDGTIEVFLDRLAAEQQEDGGWPIDWPAPGLTAVSEWRGVRTLAALEVLTAYGRLAEVNRTDRLYAIVEELRARFPGRCPGGGWPSTSR